MFSISFRKHRDEKRETTSFFPLIIKMKILFARVIIMSTHRANSAVFQSTYGNTIFNQSALAFS